jgi:hypothetical protein
MEPVDKWPEIASHIAGSRLRVVPGGQATVLILSVAGSAFAEITVPDEVLEWFVTVRNSDGVEALSDWMDHYGGSRVDLEREMREEICALVDKLLGAATRFRATPRGRILEAEHDGVWAQVLPFDAGAAG